MTTENESVQSIERVLDEVDTAMRRLADGDYQSCIVCGGPIGRERLIENPLETNCEVHPQLQADAG